jgi:hypothetical protein
MRCQSRISIVDLLIGDQQYQRGSPMIRTFGLLWRVGANRQEARIMKVKI